MSTEAHREEHADDLRAISARLDVAADAAEHGDGVAIALVDSIALELLAVRNRIAARAGLPTVSGYATQGAQQ